MWCSSNIGIILKNTGLAICCKETKRFLLFFTQSAEMYIFVKNSTFVVSYLVYPNLL